MISQTYTMFYVQCQGRKQRDTAYSAEGRNSGFLNCVFNLFDFSTVIRVPSPANTGHFFFIYLHNKSNWLLFLSLSQKVLTNDLLCH